MLSILIYPAFQPCYKSVLVLIYAHDSVTCFTVVSSHHLFSSAMKRLPIYALLGAGLAGISLGGISACDKDSTCAAISLAELIIPQVLNLYYPNGQPMVNPNTGQQMQDTNMMVFNQRTGEYFSPYYGSRAGVQLGDFLQIGVQILNKYKPLDCQSLANASASDTGFRVAFRNTAGQISYTSMPNSYTPGISAGGQQLAVTGFQIKQPGYYFVQTDADKPDKIKEFDEQNNNFTNPTTGTPMGLTANSNLQAGGAGFEVQAPADWSSRNKVDIQLPPIIPSYVGATAESRATSELVRFVESSAYAAYYFDRAREAQSALSSN
jgi:hypothetical protein